MNRSQAGGFTLVEVLVALAIIAFGLIAVFGQMGQSATAALHLREKTIAHWVAMNTLTELRLSGQFPDVGTQSDDIEMANIRWRYEIKISETASPDLRRADVSVSFEDGPDRPVATATGFLGQPTASTAAPGAGSGFPLLSPDGTLPADESGQTPTPSNLPGPSNQPKAPATNPEDAAGGAAR